MVVTLPVKYTVVVKPTVRAYDADVAYDALIEGIVGAQEDETANDAVMFNCGKSLPFPLTKDADSTLY
jgi:hypothetical protein